MVGKFKRFRILMKQNFAIINDSFMVWKGVGWMHHENVIKTIFDVLCMILFWEIVLYLLCINVSIVLPY